jgi:hypothetical protein
VTTIEDYHYLCILMLAFLGAFSDGHAAERPNVSFIFSDDVDNFLGCYGDNRNHINRVQRQWQSRLVKAAGIEPAACQR